MVAKLVVPLEKIAGMAGALLMKQTDKTSCGPFRIVWLQPTDWQPVAFPFALVFFGMATESPWSEDQN